MPEPDQPHKTSLWPGLEPYSDGESSSFFGRSREITEMCERIGRRVSTVLFAQSGVGKTSLLKAGVFPALKKKGLYPIYIRLDHGDNAPSLTDQIWLNLQRENLLAQSLVESRENYSLWEWCHDLKEGLLSERTSRAVPVFVIDQFEEIFTIGTGNPIRKPYVESLLKELADLVENRMPLSFQAKVDSDENFDLDRYDVDSDSYRIVIALREDYLSLLDRERIKMPMVMQNRMLLDRLFGEAAMEVVTGPDPSIIGCGVAELIVRHVAGDASSPLDEFQVEPALLSLVCRELDMARGSAQITPELLKGRKDGILETFYEKCFDGIPPEFREFVEENMVTESGHRQSLVAFDLEERLTTQNLNLLIGRRLLRIEQHGQTPKVEFTHDVLVPLVVRSRSASRERAVKLEAQAKEVAAVAHLLEEKAKRKRMAWWLFASILVASTAIIFALMSAILHSDLAVANAALLENEKNLVRVNAALRENEEKLINTNKSLEVINSQKNQLNSELEKALAASRDATNEAKSARERAEAYLSHFMSGASTLVSGATQETGGLGPRTRTIILSKAREMYESLEKIPSAVDSALSGEIRDQLFQIRIGEASAAMSNLDYTKSLKLLDEASEEFIGVGKANTAHFTANLAETRGDVFWDMGVTFYSKASTTRDRNENGAEFLEEQGVQALQSSVEAFKTALDLTAADSLNQIRIRNKLANSMRRLKQWNEAEKLLQVSLGELEKTSATTHENAILTVKQMKADTLHKIGNVHWDRATFGVARGQLTLALEAFRGASALRHEVLNETSDKTTATYELALSLANTSDVLVRLGLKDGIEEKSSYRIYGERVDLARSLYDENPENPFYRRFYANGLRELAMKCFASKDLANYVKYAEKAVFVDRFQNPLYLKTYSDALNRNNRQEERKAIEAMIRKLEELPDEQTSLSEK